MGHTGIIPLNLRPLSTYQRDEMDDIKRRVAYLEIKELPPVATFSVIMARDSSGLQLQDDAGNLGIHILDGGRTLFNTSTSLTGAQGTGQVQIDRGSNGQLLLTQTSANAGGPSVELLKRRSAWDVLSDGDIIGGIFFSGADSVDAALAAKIDVRVDGAPGSNDMPGRMIFYTSADGSASPTESFRINSSQNIIVANGKRIETDTVQARDSSGLSLFEDSGVGIFVEDGGEVGIGTTTPGAPLHIFGSASNEVLRLDDPSATGSPYMNFRQAGTRRSYIQHADSADDLRVVSEFGIITFRGSAAALRATINDVGLILASGFYFQGDQVRARDSNGLVLLDDGGNYGIYINDGGLVNVGTSATAVSLLAVTGAGGLDSATPPRLTVRNTTSGTFNAALQEIASLDFYSDDTSGGSARTRARISLENTNTTFGTSDLAIGLDTAGAFAKLFRLTGNWSVNSQLLVLGDVSAAPKTMMEINSPGGADSSLSPILTIRNTSNITLNAANQTIAAVDFWSDDASGSGAGVKAAIRLLNFNTSFGTSVLSLWSQGAGGDGTGATFPTYEHLRLVGTGYTEMKAGQSSGLEAKLGGTLFSGFASTGNVGTGEDNIASYSVPANTLATNGDSIWFEASGTMANNANSKNLRARFGTSGTTLIIDSGTVSGNAVEWVIRGRIIRTGSATQRAYATMILTIPGVASSAQCDVTTALDQDLTNAITLRITGEGVSNNDIVCTTFTVGWDANNT